MHFRHNYPYVTVKCGPGSLFYVFHPFTLKYLIFGETMGTLSTILFDWTPSIIRLRPEFRCCQQQGARTDNNRGLAPAPGRSTPDPPASDTSQSRTHCDPRPQLHDSIPSLFPGSIDSFITVRGGLQSRGGNRTLPLGARYDLRSFIHPQPSSGKKNM